MANTTNWLHLTDDEEVLWSGRPSLYTVAPGILLGLVVTAVGIGFTVAVTLLPALVPAFLTGQPMWLPFILVAGGALFVVGEYIILKQTRYVVTTEEVYRKEGLVAKNIRQIRHDRIQNTTCNQSLLERLFSFGDITIYTAGTDEVEINLTDVPHPHKVNGILTETLDDTADQTGGTATP